LQVRKRLSKLEKIAWKVVVLNPHNECHCDGEARSNLLLLSYAVDYTKMAAEQTVGDCFSSIAMTYVK